MFDVRKYERIRRCIFRPYRERSKMFVLSLYARKQDVGLGPSRLAYTLTFSRLIGPVRVRQLLFSGEDFKPSPLHADDSDEAIVSLMNFLTLRPGDTDKEYFENYTQEQFDFCYEHAEVLLGEVVSRFGEYKS